MYRGFTTPHLIHRAAEMEQRTRSFTQSGTGLVEIDGTAVHGRWRMTGRQEYEVGEGAAIDGRRIDITVTIYFDKLPDEMTIVQELLARVSADRQRALTVDLGRTRHAALYCREVQTDNRGNPSGITFSDRAAAKPSD